MPPLMQCVSFFMIRQDDCFFHRFSICFNGPLIQFVRNHYSGGNRCVDGIRIDPEVVAVCCILSPSMPRIIRNFSAFLNSVNGKDISPMLCTFSTGGCPERMNLPSVNFSPFPFFNYPGDLSILQIIFSIVCNVYISDEILTVGPGIFSHFEQRYHFATEPAPFFWRNQPFGFHKIIQNAN